MWLPGVRNLHSARETWEIKAGIDESIDKLVAGVENVDTQECLEVHKVIIKTAGRWPTIIFLRSKITHENYA